MKGTKRTAAVIDEIMSREQWFYFTRQLLALQSGSEANAGLLPYPIGAPVHC